MTLARAPRFEPLRSEHLVRASILVLVTVLCLFPALVRATRPLIESKPSPIRLSRGFDAPPAKDSVAPPADVAILPDASRVPEPPRPILRLVTVDLPLGPVTLAHAPDVLRGPPAAASFIPAI